MIETEAQGSFLTKSRPDAPYLVAAPHGRFDIETESIVANLFEGKAGTSSEPAPFGSLVAYSFREHSPSGIAHNVNRPSTLTNDTCLDKPELAKSKLVFESYMAHLVTLLGGTQCKLYVEIHGQSVFWLASTIDTATSNITADQARQIKAIAEEELVNAGFSSNDLKMAIEPIDYVYFNANPTKQCGSIARLAPCPALHAEIPAKMRRDTASVEKSVRFFDAALRRIAAEVIP